MAPEIKAIITDVDGVMVGKQPGVNFPLPHTEIITALSVAGRNIPIVLCSAKFRGAIDGIIQQAHLANPHIADGGAVIFNPFEKSQIIQQAIIEASTVEKFLSQATGYIEVYTISDYYIQAGWDESFLDKRTELLQKPPVIVDSLAEAVSNLQVIKIISLSENDTDMARIESELQVVKSEINYIWSHHPRIMPRKPCVITAPGVSKRSASEFVADSLGVPLENILGIGDSPADWNFMEVCGYAATVGDDAKLLNKLHTKQLDKIFAAGSVNEHALLEIFDHFGINYR